jgi:cob(I)alamin adenosyltransferase
MSDKEIWGLIHVYTGDGKGKTTAALGLALRAAGRGKKVGIIQFLKDQTSGEHLFLARYPGFDIKLMNPGESRCASPEELRREIERTLDDAEAQLTGGNYDLLILDEIFIAIKYGHLTTGRVLELLDRKPATVELVLTGRYAPAEIMARADLVSEVRLVKHPYQQGIKARPGIEY